jgi:hypothetical protein
MPKINQQQALVESSLPSISLRPSSSLVEALDMFKKSGKTALPVYRKQLFIGNLQKSALLKTITEVLSEIGGD